MNTTEHLERLALRAWPALEEVEYDGWRLRAAQGYTGRANAVVPLAHGGVPVAEKIAHCERWYAARRLPVKFRVTAFSQPRDLDATLTDRGYQQVDSVATITRSLILTNGSTLSPLSAAQAPKERRHPTVPGTVVELSVDDWFAGKTGATVSVQRAIIERIAATRWLMGWRCDGTLVARGVAVLEDGWLGIFNVSVVEAQRRRGFGRALMEALLQRAADHGARGAYLQVDEENAAAMALYAALGFRLAYRYWYRVRVED